MRLIDGVRKRGGKVVSFKSYCGGLPAPEANDNPFGYKFSWSPRGVLLAGRNSARYRMYNHQKEVPSERLFRDVHTAQIRGHGPHDRRMTGVSRDFIQ
ncbi:MAG: saccharopine dehydrogenase C-terminal domain-containing protein, partial [Acidobacteriota bacterium]